MKLSRLRAMLRCWLVCALVTSVPTVTRALETVLDAPGASEDLTKRLEETSSVFTAESRGLDTPLEILSAALSDYRTIVQILYDEGFFSPVVSIKLDGREAADLDSLSGPSQINRA
ncbi:MAG: autotransporter assembly complex protein TamA, partial [Ruegeria sp.]